LPAAAEAEAIEATEAAGAATAEATGAAGAKVTTEQVRLFAGHSDECL
jgi:hypothetical protein